MVFTSKKIFVLSEWDKMDCILDTNIWIYLLEGRAEINDLKIKIKNQQVSPVLTPVIFAEVLGWNELSEVQNKSIREYFASLEMFSIQMEHWEQVITWRQLNFGKKLPDLLIGANAKISNIPIMTRNINDFKRLSVHTNNPWVEKC